MSDVGDDWKTRGPLNRRPEVARLDPIPETLRIGDRFEHPSITHGRFAQDLGLKLIRHGRWWIVIEAALCVLLLSGCLNWRGPHHPVAGAEREAVAAARGAWIDAGRPDLTGEYCAALEHVEVVIVSPWPNGRSPCVYLDRDERGDLRRGYGAACMIVVQPYIGAPAHLAIYLDISLDEQGRLAGITHESLHYMRGCSLRAMLATRLEVEELWWGVPEDEREQAQPPSLLDHGHRDRELWGAILSDALRRIR